MFPVRSFSLYWLNSVCQLTEAGVWLQLAPGMAGIQAEDTNRERFVMMEQDHPRLLRLRYVTKNICMTSTCTCSEAGEERTRASGRADLVEQHLKDSFHSPGLLSL